MDLMVMLIWPALDRKNTFLANFRQNIKIIKIIKIVCLKLNLVPRAFKYVKFDGDAHLS